MGGVPQLPRLLPTPASVHGGLAYTVGQLPLVDGVLAAVGRAGAEVSLDRARECARICADNAVASIAAAIGSLDRVAHVIKVNGFVASPPSFTAQRTVLEGAYEVFAAAFPGPEWYSRRGVAVAALPRNSPVELDLVVELA